ACFFFSSRRRHTRFSRDWSSDVCSSDLSARLLAAVSRLLADKVFAGLQVNAERAREYAESSPSIVTPLNRYIGYEEAAAVAKQALRERKTIRQVVLERGYVEAGKLTLEQLDEALDVLKMAQGK